MAALGRGLTDEQGQLRQVKIDWDYHNAFQTLTVEPDGNRHVLRLELDVHNETNDVNRENNLYEVEIYFAEFWPNGECPKPPPPPPQAPSPPPRPPRACLCWRCHICLVVVFAIRRRISESSQSLMSIRLCRREWDFAPLSRHKLWRYLPEQGLLFSCCIHCLCFGLFLVYGQGTTKVDVLGCSIQFAGVPVPDGLVGRTISSNSWGPGFDPRCWRFLPPLVI